LLRIASTNFAQIDPSDVIAVQLFRCDSWLFDMAAGVKVCIVCVFNRDIIAIAARLRRVCGAFAVRLRRVCGAFYHCVPNM
jgi:hypothetical protein